MTSIISKYVRVGVRTATAGAIALAVGAAFLSPGAALAQEHRDHFEPYHTPHMVYDNRYSHGHYYPALGYSVSVLPTGYVSLSFGARHVFYHGGVWFEPRGPGFIVVRPPIGIVVPILPPAYTTLWVAGVPYYYANDVYYTQGPGGYMVVQPPPDQNYVEQQVPPGQYGPPPGAPGQYAPPAQYVAPPGQYGPPPAQYAAPSGQYSPPPGQYMPPAPQAAAPAPGPGPGDKWYYCESAKGYYPYVPECKEGWRIVPAAPQPH